MGFPRLDRGHQTVRPASRMGTQFAFGIDRQHQSPPAQSVRCPQTHDGHGGGMSATKKKSERLSSRIRLLSVCHLGRTGESSSVSPDLDSCLLNQRTVVPLWSNARPQITEARTCALSEKYYPHHKKCVVIIRVFKRPKCFPKRCFQESDTFVHLLEWKR